MDWGLSGGEEVNRIEGLAYGGGIDEVSPDLIEAVAEDGFCRPFVALEADGVGFVQPVPDLVRPAKGDGEDGDQLRDALVVGYVGVFEIEAAGFHGGEQGLDFPAQGVGGQGLFRLGIGDEDQQLAACQAGGGDPDGPGFRAA